MVILLLNMTGVLIGTLCEETCVKIPTWSPVAELEGLPGSASRSVCSVAAEVPGLGAGPTWGTFPSVVAVFAIEKALDALVVRRAPVVVLVSSILAEDNKY